MADRRTPLRACGALAALAAAACSAVESTSADRFTATGELVALSGGEAGAARACFTCHGLDGRGDGAGTPRLAGLDAGYLLRQLDGYGTGLRRHPEMEFIARRLSPLDRHRVSSYYAALAFTPAERPTAPAPALYVRGDPGRGLQPCADCHGRLGEGVGPANPALGAQPAAYLAEQLDQWARSERRNDPLNIMQSISRRLSPDERSALAVYASALPGGPPNRGSRATFPEARRADPRNDASAPRAHEAVR